MKIIAVGSNYRDHIKEMGSLLGKDPVVFLKPDSALLINNKPFYLPDFCEEVHYEAEIVVKISRVGRSIEKRYAHRYYDELTLGIDFTARDMQKQAKEKGQPWTLAKGFDGSAPIGNFVPKTNYKDTGDMNFSLEKNGETVQQANTSQMIHSIEEIITYVSRYFTLKMGDLIYTGTPSGVGPVSIGDHLVGKIEDKTFLDFHVK